MPVETKSSTNFPPKLTTLNFASTQYFYRVQVVLNQIPYCFLAASICSASLVSGYNKYRGARMGFTLFTIILVIVLKGKLGKNIEYRISIQEYSWKVYRQNSVIILIRLWYLKSVAYSLLRKLIQYSFNQY